MQLYGELKNLQKLQETMSRALGLSAVIAYPDGRPLTEITNLCSFCALINSNPEGKARCAASRAASVRAAASAGKAVTHTCHAGLVHLATPLNVEGELAAVLVGGSVALQELAKEAVLQLARETGIGHEELLAATMKVPVWSEERLSAATGMIQAVAETVARLLYTEQELQKKVNELTALFEFSKTVSSSLKLAETARQGLEAVLRMTGAAGGSVLMLDEAEPGAATAEVAAALEPDNGPGVIPAGEIIAAVGREAAAAHFDDEKNAAEGKRPAVAVPLTVGGRVTGVLTLAGRPGGQHFTGEETVFLTTLGTALGLALENARLYSSLRKYYLNVVQALAAALEARDAYTRGHSLRVAKLARLCARFLGLGAGEQEQVYMAGLLHDIGKIGVRENILLKPGPLTPEERKEMQGHPEVGARILEPAGFPGGVTAAVRHHHEDYGGGGYPDGLSGEEIPLLARIIRVADAYDAMTSARPYRKALTPDQAFNELKRCAGSQFDPRVVEAFLRIPGDEMVNIDGGGVATLLAILGEILFLFKQVR
ncbi:HD domain-containing phosphohydrolase [Desulfofundulus thermocisternus]|uniref:HD domain-containing phosphohydrolase n=1 Tax=Desulfofundulus thermocisternus TaxID=42471 RepID=UPI00217E228A|nr:HD domain-containing phosphohydrolase [Desulfofundulus thermocisternus]MCS5695566.1 PocR ligand-binding domain-containing protein [Desulfofundulus thermocisternus]